MLQKYIFGYGIRSYIYFLQISYAWKKIFSFLCFSLHHLHNPASIDEQHDIFAHSVTKCIKFEIKI